jgi:hypothetical protein
VPLSIEEYEEFDSQIRAAVDRNDEEKLRTLLSRNMDKVRLAVADAIKWKRYIYGPSNERYQTRQ